VSCALVGEMYFKYVNNKVHGNKVAKTQSTNFNDGDDDDHDDEDDDKCFF
jgi:hypothetical protein